MCSDFLASPTRVSSHFHTREQQSNSATGPVASGQLEFLVHQAMVLAGAAGAAIALEEQGAIVCRARSGSAAPELGSVLDPGLGLSGKCITSGQILACSDTKLDDRVNAEACEALGVRSILVLPLKKSDNVVGLLEVMAREPDVLTARVTRKLEPVIESIESVVAGTGKVIGELLEAASGPRRLERELSASVPAHVFGTFQAKTGDDSLTWRSRVATRSLLVLVVLLFMFFVGRALIEPRSKPNQAVASDAISPAELRRPAELGDTSAQYALGVALQRGDGVQRDEAAGARWLDLAAKHGNANAQYEFANALMDGRGVQQDMVEACAWFTVAAFSGKPVSEAVLSSFGQKLSPQELAKVRYRLGQIFSSGLGVPQDYVAAYAWFALSQAAGYSPAGRDKAALASEMNQQQISEAKKRVAEWLGSERAQNTATAHSQ